MQLVHIFFFYKKQQPIVLYSFWKLLLSTNTIHYMQLHSIVKDSGNKDYLKTNKQNLQLPTGRILLFWRGKCLDDDFKHSSQWLQRVRACIIFTVDIIKTMTTFNHFPEHIPFSVCAWSCDPNISDMGETNAQMKNSESNSSVPAAKRARVLTSAQYAATA